VVEPALDWACHLLRRSRGYMVVTCR